MEIQDRKFNKLIQKITKKERALTHVLQTLLPQYTFKHQAGPNKTDIIALSEDGNIRGLEAKFYEDFYRLPCIELKVNGKYSGWYTDKDTHYLVVNHNKWIHVYDAQKLRALVDGIKDIDDEGWIKKWKLRQFSKWVNQGDGTESEVVFLSLIEHSDIHWDAYWSELCDIDYPGMQEFEVVRWDMHLIPKKWTPYIQSFNLKKERKKLIHNQNDVM
jgi:hypothetical protein